MGQRGFSDKKGSEKSFRKEGTTENRENCSATPAHLMACSTACPKRSPLVGAEEVVDEAVPPDPREGLMPVKNSTGLYWLPLKARR